MNVYLDSNVLVADAVLTHPRHEAATTCVENILRRRWTPVISSHGLAEVYGVLTGTPFPRRISPSEAWQIVQENVLQFCEIQSLSRTDYTEILRNCAAQGFSGGQVFDAIHVHAARKANCNRIFTFNLDHFRRIAPDLRDRIVSP